MTSLVVRLQLGVSDFRDYSSALYFLYLTMSMSNAVLKDLKDLLVSFHIEFEAV